MKERRSFKQNLKIRQSGRSSNRRRSGRSARAGRMVIGRGAEGPGGPEAGSSVHQYKKTRGVIGEDPYLQNSWSSPLKSCHLEYSLWIWVIRWLIIFSGETDQCSLPYPRGRFDRPGSFYARARAIGPISARDCAWPCTCVDKPS
jgi:hypothetical protein